jgi:chromosomal replication initiator protein
MPKDLSQYLATRVRGSIRELEGVLNNLAQLCRMHGRPPSLEFARQHLARMLPEGPPELDARSIIDAVASAYAVDLKDLLGSSRVKGLVTPRHVSMWLIRRHTQLSSPEIGRLFGKDHSTVLHACGKVDGQLEGDSGLRSIVQMIERNLIR